MNLGLGVVSDHRVHFINIFNVYINYRKILSFGK
jgi:hypothetical protein